MKTKLLIIILFFVCNLYSQDYTYNHELDYIVNEELNKTPTNKGSYGKTYITYFIIWNNCKLIARYLKPIDENFELMPEEYIYAELNHNNEMFLITKSNQKYRLKRSTYIKIHEYLNNN